MSEMMWEEHKTQTSLETEKKYTEILQKDAIDSKLFPKYSAYIVELQLIVCSDTVYEWEMNDLLSILRKMYCVVFRPCLDVQFSWIEIPL